MSSSYLPATTDSIAHALERTFLRQRVEARLASLLMESKEYSEALSVLSGLIKEVRRLVDKLLLVDIDLMRRKLFVFFPVRALSEFLIVFLSSSSSSLNLNIDHLPLAFIARKRPRRFVSRSSVV
ncbi:hypothetical protein L3X38_024548 [Prunus dulcis]|uniref:Uncharacterized protein n=1 Tax=Prunus dulcis TaxID=3755 RepID=A0AAD4W025_PRUDU|nr:hypothetical protein L3X38_024548 [Prunus dulcis]